MCNKLRYNNEKYLFISYAYSKLNIKRKLSIKSKYNLKYYKDNDFQWRGFVCYSEIDEFL